MPVTQSPDETIEEPEEDQADQTGSLPGPLGQLPRFPTFQRRRPPAEITDPGPPPQTHHLEGADPYQEPVTAPPVFSPPAPEVKSSPESTNPDRPDPPADKPVDPADLQAAVRQAVDIAFVAVGQWAGTLEKRARQLHAVDPRWMPTVEEREMVLGPASRIAKRHITANETALDTIDGCMIGVGVASFGLRTFTGYQPLGATSAQP